MSAFMYRYSSSLCDCCAFVFTLLSLPDQPLKFLDKAKIKAILINEGITMHRVVFYLAFVVAGRDKMVVAFENLKPRLHILIKIYR